MNYTHHYLQTCVEDTSDAVCDSCSQFVSYSLFHQAFHEDVDLFIVSMKIVCSHGDQIQMLLNEIHGVIATACEAGKGTPCAAVQLSSHSMSEKL